MVQHVEYSSYGANRSRGLHKPSGPVISKIYPSAPYESSYSQASCHTTYESRVEANLPSNTYDNSQAAYQPYQTENTNNIYMQHQLNHHPSTSFGLSNIDINPPSYIEATCSLSTKCNKTCLSEQPLEVTV